MFTLPVYFIVIVSFYSMLSFQVHTFDIQLNFKNVFMFLFYNQWQKLWEKLLFGKFCVSTPFSHLTMLRTMSKSCVKLCYGFATLYRGRGGILNTLFKIPKIFCHWLSEIYKKKKKKEFLCMLFQKTQMCFNEPDYVTAHTVMNKVTANGAKIATKCCNNVFQQLSSRTCWKSVITSTQWQMLQFG